MCYNLNLKEGAAAMNNNDLMDFLAYTWIFEEEADEQGADENAADCPEQSGGNGVY